MSEQKRCGVELTELLDYQMGQLQLYGNILAQIEDL